ncbi:hypothetical protein PG994_000557 [Apiospora phragmitis]|uniref:Uncharacterized protein n=1 Tax=Apiospora phragmitis TaxID=2905665 RepID=A0ABR1X6U2_9PEZI
MASLWDQLRSIAKYEWGGMLELVKKYPCQRSLAATTQLGRKISDHYWVTPKITGSRRRLLGHAEDQVGALRSGLQSLHALAVRLHYIDAELK